MLVLRVPLAPLPLPIGLWLCLVGILWLNSILIGAWFNITTIQQLQRVEFFGEIVKVIAIAPVAGILESAAAFWAVVQWVRGNRVVSWKPTPKTGAADKQAITKGAVS